MRIELFGLLYLQEGERSALNLRAKSFEDQCETYVRNAITLYRSLKQNGITFTLLSNRPDFVQTIADRVGSSYSPPVQSIPFTTVVPKGVNFYSCHFRQDVYRFFSHMESYRYVGVLDLDMVCLRGAPQKLINLANQGTPVFYDITDQMTSGFGDTMIKDIETLILSPTEGRWAGGELLMGPPIFFRLLLEKIELVYEIYARKYCELHNTSDEVWLSAALELLRRDRVYIANGGTLDIVGRFWSTLNIRQKPFEEFLRVFLLHLPWDKKFLADACEMPTLSSVPFLTRYRKYLRKRFFISIFLRLPLLHPLILLLRKHFK